MWALNGVREWPTILKSWISVHMWPKNFENMHFPLKCAYAPEYWVTGLHWYSNFHVSLPAVCLWSCSFGFSQGPKQAVFKVSVVRSSPQHQKFNSVYKERRLPLQTGQSCCIFNLMLHECLDQNKDVFSSVTSLSNCSTRGQQQG